MGTAEVGTRREQRRGQRWRCHGHPDPETRDGQATETETESESPTAPPRPRSPTPTRDRDRDAGGDGPNRAHPGRRGHHADDSVHATPAEDDATAGVAGPHGRRTPVRGGRRSCGCPTSAQPGSADGVMRGDGPPAPRPPSGRLVGVGARPRGVGVADHQPAGAAHPDRRGERRGDRPALRAAVGAVVPAVRVARRLDRGDAGAVPGHRGRGDEGACLSSSRRSRCRGGCSASGCSARSRCPRCWPVCTTACDWRRS